MKPKKKELKGGLTAQQKVSLYALGQEYLMKLITFDEYMRRAQQIQKK